jgi:hypothetical protein
MGLWKKVKKAVKKVGKQVKRSAAVAAPALLGPGLGAKVGVAIAKTAGKTAQKATYKGIGQVSNVTGRVVQVGGTALATWFGGPVAGAAVYRGTALLRQLDQKQVKDAKQAAGLTSHGGKHIAWKKHAVRTASTVGAAVVGGAALSLAGGSGLTSTFASVPSLVGGIFKGGAAVPMSPTGDTSSPEMDASTADMLAGETGGGFSDAGIPGSPGGGGSGSGWLDTLGGIGTGIIGAMGKEGLDPTTPSNPEPQGGGILDQLGELFGGGDQDQAGAGGISAWLAENWLIVAGVLLAVVLLRRKG